MVGGLAIIVCWLLEAPVGQIKYNYRLDRQRDRKLDIIKINRKINRQIKKVE